MMKSHTLMPLKNKWHNHKLSFRKYTNNTACQANKRENEHIAKNKIGYCEKSTKKAVTVVVCVWRRNYASEKTPKKTAQQM